MSSTQVLSDCRNLSIILVTVQGSTWYFFCVYTAGPGNHSTFWCYVFVVLLILLNMT